MYILSVVILLVFLLIDTVFLKKYNRELFLDVFQVQKRSILAIVMVSLIALLFPITEFEWFSYVTIIFVCPIFFHRRHEMLSLDPDRPQPYINSDERVERWHLWFEGSRTLTFWFYLVIVWSMLFQKIRMMLGWELTEIDELMAEAVFSTGLAAWLIYRSAMRFSPKGFWKNLGFQIPASRWTASVLPVIMGLVCAASSVMIILRRNVHPSTPLSESLQTADTSWILMIFFVLALIVAPLFEEIVFRGYYFHIIRKVLGLRTAVISIAMAFAVLHVPQYWGDWMAILMVSLVGFGLTLIRVWSGTTRASVVMHYVYNIGVTIIPIVVLVVGNPAYFEYEAGRATLSVERKQELLRQSIKDRPEFADAYNELAWLMAEERLQLNEALTIIDQALELSPDNVMYLDTKAEVYEQLGQYESELQLRQRITDMTTDQSILDIQQERIDAIDHLRDYEY